MMNSSTATLNNGKPLNASKCSITNGLELIVDPPPQMKQAVSTVMSRSFGLHLSHLTGKNPHFRSEIRLVSVEPVLHQVFRSVTSVKSTKKYFVRSKSPALKCYLHM